MSSYGALDTEETNRREDIEPIVDEKGWRESLGEKLENEKFHWAVLSLVLIDAVCVIVQIAYTFFNECQMPDLLSKSPDLYLAFEIAESVSIFICIMFMFECVLSLVAFGPRYYWPGYPHWKLHLFDVVVVSTTFVLEVILKGKEREVAGLLIIFRLWRVVKIIEAAIRSVSFSQQEELDDLKAAYAELQIKYQQEVEKNRA
ncbi:hypothetical protein EDC96DRAFT_442580 [Choanephora cucurbitarum]|nr:hypothetical protein EDC96DRAFT_442580 [Choanephora cucurbitarum]